MTRASWYTTKGVMCCLLWFITLISACSSTVYHPMSALSLDEPVRMFEGQLKGRRLHLRCSANHHEEGSSHQLCQTIESALTQQGAEVLLDDGRRNNEVEAESNRDSAGLQSAGPNRPMLLTVHESWRSYDVSRWSMLFHYLTYTFYPYEEKQFIEIKLSLHNAEDALIDERVVGAMFSTWHGIGYFLAEKSVNLFESSDEILAAEERASRDLFGTLTAMLVRAPPVLAKDTHKEVL